MECDDDTMQYGLSLLETPPDRVRFVGFIGPQESSAQTVQELRELYPDDRVEDNGRFLRVTKLHDPKTLKMAPGLSAPGGPMSLPELQSLYNRCTVLYWNGSVRIRHIVQTCKTCHTGIRAEDRRGQQCLRCHKKTIVDCEFCNRKVEREHRCVRLPGEVRKNGRVYRLCTHCNQYIAKNALKRHIQRKHQQYTFQCRKCPKKFGCQSDLNHHMTTHSSERRFRCRHCGETFRWQSHRSKHVKEKHPDIDRPLQSKPISLGAEINIFNFTTPTEQPRVHRGLQDILRDL